MAIADNMPRDRPEDLLRRIADIERGIRELRAARNLDQASITASAGLGIRTSDFDGTDFAHPGTTGNYFGGDGLVVNAVYFRPSIIGNDALSDPVVPGVVNAQATNITLASGGSAALAEKVGVNLVVPDLCTRLLANVQGSIYAINPNSTGGSNGAGGDAYYCGIRLDGSAWSDTSPVGVSGSNGFATAATTEAYSLTGLTPGDTLRLSVGGASGFNSIPASSTNRATLSATLLWLR